MGCEKILRYTTNSSCIWWLNSTQSQLDQCYIDSNYAMVCPGLVQTTTANLANMCPHLVCVSSTKEEESFSANVGFWILLSFILLQLLLLIILILSFCLSARLRHVILSACLKLGSWLMSLSYAQMDSCNPEPIEMEDIKTEVEVDVHNDGPRSSIIEMEEVPAGYDLSETNITPSDLTSMKIQDLRSLAKRLNINTKNMKKLEIVQAITDRIN